jgi:methionyl aminopeptidase
MSIHLKTPAELITMREAGRIVATALAEMKDALRPGINTYDLDQITVKVFQKFGARPAFLGYPPGSQYPFPASINASINTELVHGIPNKDRIVQEGDIISLDTACHYKGFVADAAFTTPVGEVAPEVQRLLAVTEEALHVGIRASREGRQTKDVAREVQLYVESQGFSVIREYTGHGVGHKMHEEPTMPNWWPATRQEERRFQRQARWRSYPLKRGMTYALEPMVSMGSPETKELDDHWTVVMADGAMSAHFEHTIAIVDQEPLILTLL